MPDMKRDSVDVFIEAWKREWPDTDPSPLAVGARIVSAFQTIDREVTSDILRYGLSPGEFAVLMTLRLAAPEQRLTPTQLCDRLLVSSGGITARVDRLEQRELVRRVPNPGDRRSVPVELTPGGLEMVNAAAEPLLNTHERLLGPLPADELKLLEGLLHKLLVEWQADQPLTPRP